MSNETALALATGVVNPPPTASADVVTPPVNQDQPKELDSTRFSHLAKKEADLVRQQQEFKKERERISQETDKLKPLHDKLLKFEELKKTDPVAAIRMLEFSDNDFVNYMASLEDKSTPEEKARKAAQEEIDKFKTDQQKKEESLVMERNKKIIDEFKSSISSVIASDKEKYELSSMLGKQAEDLAFDFVSECVKLGKEPPSAEEAADVAERYYEDYFREIMKSKKLTPQEAVQAAKEAVQDAPLRAEVSPRPTTPTKTLTSKATTTVASTVTRKESKSEKRERLMERLRNGE